MQLDRVEAIRCQASICSKITKRIDRRQMQMRSQCNKPVPIGSNERERPHDQATVWFLREVREDMLNVSYTLYRSCCHRHAQ